MKGFTLVELLIALFLFSLLSAFAYYSVNQLIVSQRMLSDEISVIEDVHKAFALWDRDVRQSLGVQGEGAEPSIRSDQISEVELDLKEMLSPVSYSLREGKLFRSYLKNFGETGGKQLVSPLTLASDVQSFAAKPISIEKVGLYAGLDMAIEHAILKSIRRVTYIGIHEHVANEFNSSVSSGDASLTEEQSVEGGSVSDEAQNPDTEFDDEL